MSGKTLFFKVFIPMIFIFSSCKDKSGNIKTSDRENMALSAEPVSNNDTEYNTAPLPLFLVKDGNLTFETESIKRSRGLIDSLLQLQDGFIVKENLLSTENTSEYKLTTKIPARNFEKFISGIENCVTVLKSKSIHIIDVTEEFTDIQSRIKIKRELENRYLHLLSKAEKMDDILLLEGELNKIRTDIEMNEGRMKALSQKIALSTLEILLYTDVLPEQENNYIHEFAASFKNGLHYVVMISLLLVNLWPFIALSFLAYAYLNLKQKKAPK